VTSPIVETSAILLGIRTPKQLAERIKEIGSTDYLIAGLIPRRALTLFVGDSGLGKSPLLYQAAISVAAGLPFLGREVQKGKVLYLDCENGLADVEYILSQVCRFAGLESPPDDLLLWNLNDAESGYAIEKLIEHTKPAWVIVDPLKAFFPDIEHKNQNVTKAYHQLRGMMQRHQCSITGVHHIRKPGNVDFTPPSLEDHNFREWFYQARGPRELINGCDWRFGLDLPRSAVDDSKLVFRGFGRVRGDTGLIQLGRSLDTDGEPHGYEQLSGVELLNNADYQNAYRLLPTQFKFKQGKAVYGKGDQATTDFLGKCVAAGVLRKLPGKSGYEKIPTEGAAQTVSRPAAEAA
jgi:hypothetical protein